MNWGNYIFLVACTLILTSCAPSLKKNQLYSGAKLSSNKIAILKDCQEKCNNYQVYIQQTKISQDDGYSDTELLPGEYDAKIHYLPALWFPKASPKAYQQNIKFKVEAGSVYSIKCELSRFRPFTGYYEPKDWKIKIGKSVAGEQCNKKDLFPDALTEFSEYAGYSLLNIFAGYMVFDKSYNNKNNIGAGLYRDLLDRYHGEIFSRIVFLDEEISAIEKRSVFLGMSEEALALSWGWPLAQISYSGGATIVNTNVRFDFDAPSMKPKEGEELFLYQNRKQEDGKLFLTTSADASYIYISNGKIARIEIAKGKIKN
ncbi:MAG: hypothetical protein KJ630_05880 [Proteobacteria bacterium]|nr:hypothetical protein [Pseudomonadota bacterium]